MNTLQETERITKITFRVDSVGRKWLHATEVNSQLEPVYRLLIKHIMQIEKNDICKDCKPGEVYTMYTRIERNCYRQPPVTFHPLKEEEITKDTLRPEITRWVGYVEERATYGSVYKKGIEQLRQLDIAEYPDLNERFRAAVTQAASKVAETYLGYITNSLKRYWYEKGEMRVREAVSTLNEIGETKVGDKFLGELERLKEHAKLAERIEIPENIAEQDEERKRVASALTKARKTLASDINALPDHFRNNTQLRAFVNEYNQQATDVNTTKLQFVCGFASLPQYLRDDKQVKGVYDKHRKALDSIKASSEKEKAPIQEEKHQVSRGPSR